MVTLKSHSNTVIRQSRYTSEEDMILPCRVTTCNTQFAREINNPKHLTESYDTNKWVVVESNSTMKIVRLMKDLPQINLSSMGASTQLSVNTLTLALDWMVGVLCFTCGQIFLVCMQNKYALYDYS